MTELYGTAFLTAYGEKPSPLWLAAISEMTDDGCRVALTTLAKQPREYPANLTQFVAASRKQSGSPRFLGVPLDAEGWKRLGPPPPEQRAKPETVSKYLESMRRKLGA